MAERRSTWEGAQRCTTSWGFRIRWSKSRPVSSILLCVRPRDEKKQFFILALDDLRYNMTIFSDVTKGKLAISLPTSSQGYLHTKGSHCERGYEDVLA